ncbi:hypothetical protein PIB30_067740 [Stylosanthes scabra]|uniref:FBD domain-containing protein n=1 Tax=Stylosanthes scabra TaxID=79078 RepID=A0ABU6WKY6_9FABA|nr:hypothetical protein [Stylosanthes scabra]
MKLLCCCPKLQVLKIDNTVGQHHGFETPQYSILTKPSSWTRPASVASCVMLELNILEFRRYPDLSEEREFFAYILQNAHALKAIIIYTYSNPWIKETDTVSYEKQKEHILKEISVFPMASSICQVEEFTGLKWYELGSWVDHLK